MDATLGQANLRMPDEMRADMTRQRFAYALPVGITVYEHDGHRTTQVCLIGHVKGTGCR